MLIKICQNSFLLSFTSKKLISYMEFINCVRYVHISGGGGANASKEKYGEPWPPCFLRLCIGTQVSTFSITILNSLSSLK